MIKILLNIKNQIDGIFTTNTMMTFHFRPEILKEFNVDPKRIQEISRLVSASLLKTTFSASRFQYC